jgi:hypothetical protein
MNTVIKYFVRSVFIGSRIRGNDSEGSRLGRNDNHHPFTRIGPVPRGGSFSPMMPRRLATSV